MFEHGWNQGCESSLQTDLTQNKARNESRGDRITFVMGARGSGAKTCPRLHMDAEGRHRV